VIFYFYVLQEESMKPEITVLRPQKQSEVRCIRKERSSLDQAHEVTSPIDRKIATEPLYCTHVSTYLLS